MSARPSILLWGDAILDPARRLLRRTQAGVDDLSSRATVEDIERSYELVVMSLAQALELEVAESAERATLPGKPVRVVIHSQDYLPLRDRLRRVGIDFLVHSSGDPGVLQLLFLHALFTGPEKRNAPRLLVGSRVAYATPEANWPGTLVDLNREGCRILSSSPVPSPETPVTVVLPAALAKGRALALRGRAVRAVRAEAEADGDEDHQFAVEFEVLDAALTRRLDTLLEGKAIGTLVTRLADCEPEPAARRETRTSERDRRGAAAAPPGEATSADAQPERRKSPRVPYSNIVTALIGDDTQILLGRDLSRSGVRVEPAADLAVGSTLRVAIYGAARIEPALVPAVVARDDGEQGLLLRFDQAATQPLAELEKILRTRGVLGPLTRLDAAGGPVVVSGTTAGSGDGQGR